ncbi:MAG: bifunctional 4-hydroxy-2-oxoglutarate aldolase/2-dehydro-3-deoxy-phosphogluconate aldolase [Anditalea sp.]
MNQSFSWELLEKMPIVGILRNFPAKQMEKLSECYAGSGLTTLEITMNSEGASQAIASLVNSYQGQLNVGAGTVCTLEDLDKALEAGAQFIVTPIVDELVINKCVGHNIPVFPGAYTPTEIYKAWSLGAGMVKVFPASKLGPDYIKEVLAPLDHIKLMPTGGVSLDNLRDFMKAGAKGLGIGSQLIPKRLVENSEWETLSRHFSEFVKEYNEFLNED